MVLRRIFRLERADMMGGWRKLHNKEFCKLYSSPSTIRKITLRRMRWVRHVARMGEKRIAYTLLVGRARGKDATRKKKMQVGG
jgi:hypothetical protein